MAACTAALTLWLSGCARSARNGRQFVIFAADGRVRVWRLGDGKLSRSYDESLEVSGKPCSRPHMMGGGRSAHGAAAALALRSV